MWTTMDHLKGLSVGVVDQVHVPDMSHLAYRSSEGQHRDGTGRNENERNLRLTGRPMYHNVPSYAHLGT